MQPNMRFITVAYTKIQNKAIIGYDVFNPENPTAQWSKARNRELALKNMLNVDKSIVVMSFDSVEEFDCLLESYEFLEKLRLKSTTTFVKNSEDNNFFEFGNCCVKIEKNSTQTQEDFRGNFHRFHYYVRDRKMNVLRRSQLFPEEILVEDQKKIVWLADMNAKQANFFAAGLCFFFILGSLCKLGTIFFFTVWYVLIFFFVTTLTNFLESDNDNEHPVLLF